MAQLRPRQFCSTVIDGRKDTVIGPYGVRPRGSLGSAGTEDFQPHVLESEPFRSFRKGSFEGVTNEKQRQFLQSLKDIELRMRQVRRNFSKYAEQVQTDKLGKETYRLSSAMSSILAQAKSTRKNEFKNLKKLITAIFSLLEIVEANKSEVKEVTTKEIKPETLEVLRTGKKVLENFETHWPNEIYKKKGLQGLVCSLNDLFL